MIEEFWRLPDESDVTMTGDPELLFCVFAAVCAAAVLVLVMCIQGTAWILWGACLLPLLLLGRTYATVGVPPVYAMDLFAVLALLATVGVWGPRLFSEPRLRGFRAVAVLLIVFTAQAVYRGVAAGYPDPLKGAVLGVYPVFGCCAAAWLLTRSPRELSRCRLLLYVPAAGALLSVMIDFRAIAAATGLYLAIAGAFAVSLHRRGDSRLLMWTLVGAAAITSLDSRRGPLLAIVAAMAATTLAGRASRRQRAIPRRAVVSWGIAIAAVLATLTFSLSGQRLGDAPVVGRLATRVESSWQKTGSESANNVRLRFMMWEESLRTAWDEPLMGAGAGRPLGVVVEGRPIDPKSGPHNSFIGYIYYLGWPAGLGFILLVAATLRRTWRARRHPVAVPWFGATVGVCVTAFTNVAFETTYIGLPSWLVLSCAYALVGVPLSDTTDSQASTGERKGLIGQRRPIRGGASGRSTARTPTCRTA